MLDIDASCADFVAICVPSGADTSTFTLAVFVVMLWGLYNTFALCLTIGLCKIQTDNKNPHVDIY